MQRMSRSVAAVLGALVLAATFTATAVADDPVASDVQLTANASGPLQDNHPITLVAVIISTGDYVTDATVDFDEVDGLGPECHGVPANGVGVECPIADLNAGTYHYTASYSGNTTTAGSASAVLEVIVAPDTVDVVEVGISYGTFYPVRDHYRDTLRIAGSRQEDIAVTIRIYDAHNKRVKLVAKALASGRYTYDWNGRTAAGAILPAGKYRIVQAFVDGAGTATSRTSYVNLSHKKLVAKTVTLTKKGSAVAAYSGNAAHAGATLRLRAGSTAAVAGWQFKIPAAVTYKSLAFRARAAAHFAVPSSLIAMQNFNLCSVWDVGCFDRAKTIGSSSGAAKWYGTTASPTAHRNGRIARGLAGVAVGTIYVYSVQLKVTYTVLR